MVLALVGGRDVQAAETAEVALERRLAVVRRALDELEELAEIVGSDGDGLDELTVLREGAELASRVSGVFELLQTVSS
jgi:hypothetical protein